MKKILLIALFIFESNAMAAHLSSVAQIAACASANKTCTATPALKEVFRVVGLQQPGTFAELIEIAQLHLRRPEGLERWQIPERFADKRDALLSLFHELGFIEAIHASKGHYNYAAIHGATLQRTESRIQWLIQEWIRGVRFDAVIALSGERTLDVEHEMPAFYERWRCCEIIPENETQMIGWLWYRAEMPEQMRSLPFTLVNAKASNWRAHTGDTVLEWLKQTPKAGTILAVSNQPYVSYQDMSLVNRLPSTFQIETIGEAASDDVMNSVYLDNLSRVLLEIRKWQER